MRKILFLLMFCFLLNGYSQNNYNYISDSIVNVTPFWEIGLEEDFYYSKTKYLISKDGTKDKIDSLEYWVNFKVKDSSQDSFDIEWTSYVFRKDLLEKKYFSNRAKDEKKSYLGGMPLKYTTDTYGEIKSFENLHLVRDYWKDKSDDFLNRNDVPQKIKELYSTEEMIQSLFLSPLEMFHEIIGYGFKIDGEEFQEIEQIDLGVVSDTLNTYNKYYLSNIDRNNLSFTFNQVTQFDNTDSLKFLESLGDSVFPNEKIGSFYENKKVSVYNTITIDFDLLKCLPKEVIFKTDVKLMLQEDVLMNYVELQILDNTTD